MSPALKTSPEAGNQNRIRKRQTCQKPTATGKLTQGLLKHTNTGKQTQTCLSSGKCQSKHHQGLPGWFTAQQSPCKAGDTVLIPHPGRSHMSGVNEAQDSQLLQLRALKPKLPKMRGHHNESLPTATTEEPPPAAPREKPGQQGRPSTVMESTD